MTVSGSEIRQQLKKLNGTGSTERGESLITDFVNSVNSALQVVDASLKDKPREAMQGLVIHAASKSFMTILESVQLEGSPEYQNLVALVGRGLREFLSDLLHMMCSQSKNFKDMMGNGRDRKKLWERNSKYFLLDRAKFRSTTEVMKKGIMPPHGELLRIFNVSEAMKTLDFRSNFLQGIRKLGINHPGVRGALECLARAVDSAEDEIDTDCFAKTLRKRLEESDTAAMGEEIIIALLIQLNANMRDMDMLSVMDFEEQIQASFQLGDVSQESEELNNVLDESFCEIRYEGNILNQGYGFPRNRNGRKERTESALRKGINEGRKTLF